MSPRPRPVDGVTIDLKPRPHASQSLLEDRRDSSVVRRSDVQQQVTTKAAINGTTQNCQDLHVPAVVNRQKSFMYRGKTCVGPIALDLFVEQMKENVFSFTLAQHKSRKL